MRGLVVVQMALAVVLLVGSGLLLLSLFRLQAVRPGFQVSERVGFSIQLAPNRYREREDRVAFYDRLTTELGALPGVRRVALARGLPMQRWVGTEVHGGRTARRPEDPPPSVDLQFTSPAISGLGIPVVEGREIEAGDRMGAPLVALINESAARVHFPGESPIGRRIRLMFAEEDWPLVTVVGVVGDVRQRSLAQPPRPELYLPPAQVPSGWAEELLQAPQVVIEAGLPLQALSPAIRGVLERLDPDVPVNGLQTMSQAVSDTAGRERFLSLVLVAFAALAVVIAGVGVYAVMAFSIQRRSREIAIRLALGARPIDVWDPCAGYRPAGGRPSGWARRSPSHGRLLFEVGPTTSGLLDDFTLGRGGRRRPGPRRDRPPRPTRGVALGVTRGIAPAQRVGLGRLWHTRARDRCSSSASVGSTGRARVWLNRPDVRAPTA
jgi:putative ABC transport system permease protein